MCNAGAVQLRAPEWQTWCADGVPRDTCVTPEGLLSDKCVTPEGLLSDKCVMQVRFNFAPRGGEYGAQTGCRVTHRFLNLQWTSRATKRVCTDKKCRDKEKQVGGGVLVASRNSEEGCRKLQASMVATCRCD
jgi:hypothetical protein